jgi:hypothetical protein
MRHFLLVSTIVIGNFILWALITVMPMHAMIMFCLAVGVGCLMIWLLVLVGKATGKGPSAKG